MATPGDTTRQLPVPVTVRIAAKSTRVEDIAKLQPGSIIELPAMTGGDLEVLINTAVIGRGQAVKVGHNYGVRITSYQGLETD